MIQFVACEFTLFYFGDGILNYVAFEGLYINEIHKNYSLMVLVRCFRLATNFPHVQANIILLR